MATLSTESFWSFPPDELLAELETSPQGLTADEAARRLRRFGHNALHAREGSGVIRLVLTQFKSPIILILIAAASLSFFLHDATDGAIILAIMFISGMLGFSQEYGANRAVKRLLATVQVKARVLRDRVEIGIPLDSVVPGDVAMLSAGSMIPGDCRLLRAEDLFVNEATLTGETYPVEKAAATLTAAAPLAERSNALFMGTHVVSGTAQAVVVRTGLNTELGKVAARLAQQSPETEFERGVRRFGYLLTEVTLIMLIIIFAVNVYLHKPILDTFLFSLALAVGLTPQLLPAIISVNLSRGARRMAAADVIVKRLTSIENFGSMDVLCSDKTGTLTEGTVRVRSALDAEGRDSERVLRYAYINAFYETGFDNPIDRAIRDFRSFDLNGVEKLDEIPYDFLRKRLSVLVSENGRHRLLTKGALTNVLDICSEVAVDERQTRPLAEARDSIQQRYQALSKQGLRTLGLAYRDLGATTRFIREHESAMAFLGFVVLEDPPKADIAETVRKLGALGVSLKMITGDNRLVAASLGERIGLKSARVLTGPELYQISDEALRVKIESVDIFAEVEPNQKERIILAFRKANHVVGYLGDGINDASALHAADVGISVGSAVDVAKEAAHFVLLKQDLNVLIEGVREGRRTFANTLKYVFMATSANFGNMFSMAGASLFLPFLPLLPKQVLLTNLLTDIPEMAIASDRVDSAMVEQPERWDIGFIRRFMITFGLLSSLFDYLTFGVLLWRGAAVDAFRTGWFLESVISATLIVLVIRTRLPLVKSRPAWPLFAATLAAIALVIGLAYAPFTAVLGFTRLPTDLLLWLAGIIALYIVSAEIVKFGFYRSAAGRRRSKS